MFQSERFIIAGYHLRIYHRVDGFKNFAKKLFGLKILQIYLCSTF